MCGIWGFLSEGNHGLNDKQLDLMWDMAIVGQQRGLDGTGIFGVNTKGKTFIAKEKYSAGFLLFNKKYEAFKARLFKDGKVFVGHNRAATRGSHINENTHPFTHQHITMVHNGTLTGGVELEYNRTDSEALCRLLAEKDHEAFEIAKGAWTVIWHDARDNTINFLTNGQRPLCIKRTYTGVAFASKEKMLDWMLDEHNMTAQNNIHIVSDTIYQFKLDTPRLEMERITLKKPWVHGSSYTNHHQFSRGQNQYPQTMQSPVVPMTTTPVGGNTPSTSATPLAKVTPLSINQKKARLGKSDQALFEVLEKTFDEKTGRYTYRGLTDSSEGVFFITDKSMPEWLGKKFLGTINGRHIPANTQQVWYQISTRSIEEVEMPNEPTYATILDANGNPIIQDGVDEAAVIAAEMEKLADIAANEANNIIEDAVTNLAEIVPNQSMKYTIELRDGLRIEEKHLSNILRQNKSRCFACQEEIFPLSYKNCSSVTNYKDGSVKGIQCPACTDMWMEQLKKLSERRRAL